MASRSHLILAVAGAFLLAGCRADEPDLVTSTDAAVYKKDGSDNCKKKPEKCLPPEPSFPGTAFEAIEGPLRMALTPAGRLLVSDARAQAIFTVDPATRLPDGELEIVGKPAAVGYLDGLVYVGNLSRGTIERYAAKGGKYRGDFGPGAVKYPTDMAVDGGAGLLFVVDGGDRNVKVFDASGRPQSTISGAGTAPGQFANPIGIAVSESLHEVYVSDYGPDGGPASIKIFGYDGTFLAEISGRGSCGSLGCSGGFSRPQGIGVAADGRLFVADALLAGVLVFDRSTLSKIASLGGRETGVPELRIPAGVTVSGDDVYVVSNRTSSVEVFEGGAQ